jgi:hypothetical protein
MNANALQKQFPNQNKGRYENLDLRLWGNW